MHWIEQLLRTTPDSGTGSLEILILSVLVAAVVAAALYMLTRSNNRLRR